MIAGDRDRDRAALALREHYAQGRLTLDEVADRAERVLEARSRAEIRSALSGLPMLFDGRELAAQGRSIARGVMRAAMLVFFTGAYLLFSFSLLLVLGLTMLIQGLSGAAIAVFFVVWAIPTYLLSRLWHRRAPHGRRRTVSSI